MPISCHIDHAKRRIIGQALGIVGEGDLFAYQSQAGIVSDYDEIFDVTNVENLQDVNLDSLRKLADFAASTDVPDTRAKLAIVASRDLYFGLGRMYEFFRAGSPRNTKEINVVHSRVEAENWLDAKMEPV